MKDALFFPNGRLALLHAMRWLGLGPGDAIVVPAYYCASGLQAIVAHGLEPVFTDVTDGLEISSQNLEAALSNRRVKAVLLVHFFGFAPTSRDETIRRCHAASVRVIEDRCHSFLSYLDSERQSLAADACIFSIRKTLPVADGGALLPGTSERGIVAAWLGRQPFACDIPFLVMRLIESAVIRFGWPNPYGGIVSRLRQAFARPNGSCGERAAGDSGAEAVLPSWSLGHLLSDGQYLRHVAQRRRTSYRKLAEALVPLKVQVVFPSLDEGEVPHVLPVLDPSRTLVDFLRERGIGAYCWPGEELSAGVRAGSATFPNAVRLNDSMVCLPVHQDIDDGHIASMAAAVLDWQRTKGSRP